MTFRAAIFALTALSAIGCHRAPEASHPAADADAVVAVDVSNVYEDASFHVFTKGDSSQRVCLHMHSSDATVAVPKAYSTAQTESGFHSVAGIADLWSDLGGVVCFTTPDGPNMTVARQEIACRGRGTATITVQGFITGPMGGLEGEARTLTVHCNVDRPLTASR